MGEYKPTPVHNQLSMAQFMDHTSSAAPRASTMSADVLRRTPDGEGSTGSDSAREVRLGGHACGADRPIGRGACFGTAVAAPAGTTYSATPATPSAADGRPCRMALQDCFPAPAQDDATLDLASILFGLRGASWEKDAAEIGKQQQAPAAPKASGALHCAAAPSPPAPAIQGLNRVSVVVQAFR